MLCELLRRGVTRCYYCNYYFALQLRVAIVRYRPHETTVYPGFAQTRQVDLAPRTWYPSVYYYTRDEIAPMLHAYSVERA